MMEIVETTNITDKQESTNGHVKRWCLTINNPIFADTGYVEIDTSNTALEIVENPYDFSVLEEEYNQEFFEYKYIQRENSDKAIKCPFFKNYDCVKRYFESLKDNDGLKYAIGQYEKGENETPHIQAFIIYTNNKRFKNVKQDFPTAHLITAKGQNSENRAYCTKKDTRIAEPFEIGVFGEMRTRNDIEQFRELLKAGANNTELGDLFPTLMFQQGVAKTEAHRQDFLKQEWSKKHRNVDVTYIYGEPQLGKSSYITGTIDKFGKEIAGLHTLEECCTVDNYKTGTFEGYDTQKILVLEEFNSQLEITFMNRLLDKKPLALPARFANRWSQFNKVYIVSNKRLEELYIKVQQEEPVLFDAFKKRIHRVVHFYDYLKYTVEENGIKKLKRVQLDMFKEETPNKPW